MALSSRDLIGVDVNSKVNSLSKLDDSEKVVSISEDSSESVQDFKPKRRGRPPKS